MTETKVLLVDPDTGLKLIVETRPRDRRVDRVYRLTGVVLPEHLGPLDPSDADAAKWSYLAALQWLRDQKADA